MYDPQMQDFRGRLARLDRMHRRGYGFEAPGTIGRSYYTRRGRARMPLLRPLALTAIIVIVVKAFILSQIGAADYNERLARVGEGSVIERAGVYIMQIDPVTEYVAEEMRKILGTLG